MAGGMLPTPAAQAAGTSENVYGVSDGVQFNEIAKGNVYYGQMKHPQFLGFSTAYYGNVTEWEEEATPILWQAMGEELDESGNGDGKLALFSRYIVNMSDFNEDKSVVNDYANSYMSKWLNDEEEGFLKDENFTAAEKAAISPSTVVTSEFTPDGEEIAGTAKTVEQKAYLPWGTASEKSDTNSSVYWSESQITGKNLIASSLTEQSATLKGKDTRIRYWLRSPEANSNKEYIVDTNVFSQYLNTQLGIRPVIKLNRDDIVFASKIVSNPSDYSETKAITPHLAASDDLTSNYKLTLAAGGEDDNPYSLNVSNHTEDEIIPVTMGDDITFAIDNISNYGAEYTINYKAVMSLYDERTIITGGASEPLDGDSAELVVSSSDFIRTSADADAIDFYLWLQKNNDYASNEASVPIHFQISLTGGEESEIPTRKPEELSPEAAKDIKMTYPDGKLKAALLSFDDLADYHYQSDKHLVDIFNKYGITGTFNMITSLVSDDGPVRKNIAEFDGHEIASHSETHPQFDSISDESLIGELTRSKAFIDELTGKDTAGLAYPYYYAADTAHLQYVKDAGYRYSRRTDPSDNFNIPTSFYNWNPTMHVLWTGGAAGGAYAMPEKTREFTDLSPEDEKLMFIWGHSTDFGNFTTGDGNDTWYLIDDFCKSISENFDTIWNPTVIDYVDYVNSQKTLGIYKGTEDNILFDNTKGLKDVWVSISGAPAVIPSGRAVEVDPEDLDIVPTPTPTSAAVTTEAPTDIPSLAPTETVKPNVPTTPPGSALLAECGFENGSSFPAVSSSGAVCEKVKSPIDSSLAKIAPATASQFTEEAIEANIAAWTEANLENSDNTVLKLSGNDAKAENKITIYEGVLPASFGLDFQVLARPSFANFNISIEQNGKSYNLIRYDTWAGCYLADLKSRYASNYAEVWLPHTLIFENFASDDTQLRMYWNGRLNYTAGPVNPQGYENAYLKLGSYYSEINLLNDVKIVLTQTGAADSIYFDDFRLYRYDGEISNEVNNDFERDLIGMPPMQNRIRTGGQIGRQWLYTSTDKTQRFYGLTAYRNSVETDPLNPSNKVLRGICGEGLNEYGYDSAVRFSVNKPKEKLKIKFKALTNGKYNMAVDIADGIFDDVFFQTESKSPADRIFSLDQGEKGQFVSSGKYNGHYASDLNWALDKWNDVTIEYDVKENLTSFNINGVEFDITPSNELIREIMNSNEDAVTLNIYRPYPSSGTYLMLDDISIVSDDGDYNGEVTPEPTEAPTSKPTETTAPTDKPTTPPTATPTATPTPEPTEPAFEGEWKSEFYPSGTGYNDKLQYPSYIKDLGDAKTINKIVLEHDSTLIMSFSLAVSEDGEEYTPVTSVYAGGTDRYSGRQIYRFAAQKVRYVKYAPVLLGEHTTQARVRSLVCSETDTVSLELKGVPSEVNPVERRHDIPLSVTVTDSDGDTYNLEKDGVSYSAENALLNGNVLTIDRDAAQGTVTVEAADLSNDVKSAASLKIDPHAVVRNVGLYADADGMTSVTALEANAKIYLRAQALTSGALGAVSAEIAMALYNADGTLASVEITDADIESQTAYEDITASCTLPDTVDDGMVLKAFIWDSEYTPLTKRVVYSDSPEVSGFADAQLFIKKSETARLRLSGTTDDISWSSSDETVATVDNYGTVTGVGDGNTVITAKSGDRILAAADVEVEPIYVFLCMGQSNMAAMRAIAAEEKEPVDVTVSEGVLLLNKQNEFEQARHSYGRHTGVIDIGNGGYTDAGDLYMPDRISMTYSFAEDFKADYPGSEIGLIVNACSGCKIDVFLKNSVTGNGFENSVARATCDSVKEKGELKGILWHQGESNCTDINYTYVFKNMMYDYRTALGDMELPIVAGGLAEDKPISQNNTNPVSFNDKLAAETANIARFGFASSRYPYVLTTNATDSTNESRKTDETHFGAKSQVEFGHRYYNAYTLAAN